MRSLPALYKALIVMGPDEERYVRPPRRYEPPEYPEGDEVLHVKRALSQAGALL